MRVLAGLTTFAFTLPVKTNPTLFRFMNASYGYLLNPELAS